MTFGLWGLVIAVLLVAALVAYWLGALALRLVSWLIRVGPLLIAHPRILKKAMTAPGFEFNAEFLSMWCRSLDKIIVQIARLERAGRSYRLVRREPVYEEREVQDPHYGLDYKMMTMVMVEEARIAIIETGGIP